MKTVFKLSILLPLFVLPVAHGEETPSQFKQQALRNPMMVLPHYQTALGRESRSKKIDRDKKSVI